MIDVHVLTLPGLPEEWVKQRRDSIEAAVAAAGFPVYVHEVEGIAGHLGRSRKKGYSVGTQPYVSHVDHDDWVREDAFSIVKPLLEEGVDAITTGEVLVRGEVHTLSPNYPHHLAVFKRDMIEGLPYDKFEIFPDQFLLSSITAKHIEECVYYHRIHESSASRVLREGRKDRTREEIRYIKNPKLLRLELMSYSEIAEEIDKELNGE